MIDRDDLLSRIQDGDISVFQIKSQTTNKDKATLLAVQNFLRDQVGDYSYIEIGSHLALMALVARGLGWAITTPLGFMRAARFHEGLSAHPAPFGAFSRTISLFTRTDWSDQVPQEVAGMTRRLMQNQIVDPALATLPWLSGSLRVIGG